MDTWLSNTEHRPKTDLIPGSLSHPFLSVVLQQVAVSSGVGGMVRPVTGADVGIRRAEIRQGLREVILCKDQDSKVGLRLRDIDNVSKSHLTNMQQGTVLISLSI